MALFAPVLEMEHIDAGLVWEMVGTRQNSSALAKLQKNRNVNASAVG